MDTIHLFSVKKKEKNLNNRWRMEQDYRIHFDVWYFTEWNHFIPSPLPHPTVQTTFCAASLWMRRAQVSAGGGIRQLSHVNLSITNKTKQCVSSKNIYVHIITQRTENWRGKKKRERISRKFVKRKIRNFLFLMFIQGNFSKVARDFWRIASTIFATRAANDTVVFI